MPPPHPTPLALALTLALALALALALTLALTLFHQAWMPRASFAFPDLSAPSKSTERRSTGEVLPTMPYQIPPPMYAIS